jgi:hypothetical protein
MVCANAQENSISNSTDKVFLQTQQGEKLLDFSKPLSYYHFSDYCSVRSQKQASKQHFMLEISMDMPKKCINLEITAATTGTQRKIIENS